MPKQIVVYLFIFAHMTIFFLEQNNTDFQYRLMILCVSVCVNLMIVSYNTNATCFS